MEFVRLWTIFVFLSTIYCIGIRRYSTDLLENDFCGLDASIYSGKCKKIKQCVNLLVDRKDIEVCSFNGKAGDETLVCCSRDDFFQSRLLNGDGPLNYETCLDKYKHLRNFESKEFSKFTVNGVEVQDGEFPHMVAIGWLRWYDFSVDWNCGGSLITESFVLTAAHCTSFDGRTPNVVRMGDKDLKSPVDDLFVQQFEVMKITKHPSYKYFENKNDIALIQFKGEVVPTKKVVPACIMSGKLPTDYFEAAGYGQNGDGLQTNKLSKVQLKNIPIDECQMSYDSVTLAADSQMCAQSYREDIETQDTCYGDSGGSLQFMSSNYSVEGKTYLTPTIVGITSFGVGCAYGHASVYVKISSYLGWMESVIMP